VSASSNSRVGINPLYPQNRGIDAGVNGGFPRLLLGVRAGQAGSMNLSRPRHDRVIAGVCAALARRFGWRTRTVRILTALSILLPGPQVIIYLVLWILIPNDVE
jgi:phage shock protein PspC (stress-responsive transcriptional regulator)